MGEEGGFVAMEKPKLSYQRPTVEFWAAAELDAIQAAMFGGGGGSTGEEVEYADIMGLS